MLNMAQGNDEHHEHYPHVQDHAEFAKEVLRLVGEG
jgi:hypothetical protein